MPISVIKKHSREWQAHQQEISDFLQEGEGVWWHLDNDTVKFHDISESPQAEEPGPLLHHFRSRSLKDEETHLHQCWRKCIDENIVIPTHIIRVDLPSGHVERLNTDFVAPLPLEMESPDCEIGLTAPVEEEHAGCRVDHNEESLSATDEEGPTSEDAEGTSSLQQMR